MLRTVAVLRARRSTLAGTEAETGARIGGVIAAWLGLFQQRRSGLPHQVLRLLAGDRGSIEVNKANQASLHRREWQGT